VHGKQCFAPLFTKKLTKAPDPSNFFESGMLLVIENNSFSQPVNKSEIFWTILQKALKQIKGIRWKSQDSFNNCQNFTYRKLKVWSEVKIALSKLNSN
jgi:hypothetical protein